VGLASAHGQKSYLPGDEWAHYASIVDPMMSIKFTLAQFILSPHCTIPQSV
jgi:hypothetical protein